MYAVGALLWAIVIGYVTLSRVFGTVRMFGHEIDLPGWRMAIVQVLLATVDVAITASIFYALLPEAPGLTWPIFLGVYVASYTAGLAANLPGGIGVFDTAMLLGLEPYIDAPHIVGAIVVFRLYYYIIPLFLAGSLFAGNEILLRGGGMLRRVARAARAGARRAGASRLRRRQRHRRWSRCAACMLLCARHAGAAAATSPGSTRTSPRSASQAGQFVPSLIGAGLIVLAIGLSQRVNLAWGATIVLLVAGAAFTAAQGERLWIPGVLVAVDHAGGAVPQLLLPPRPAAERAAAGLDARCRCSRWSSVILALAGTRAACRTCCRTTLVGDRAVARGAELAAR